MQDSVTQQPSTTGSTASRGRYIAFEGINGVGKTTLIQRVIERLRQRQVPIVITREPGGTPLGRELRRILLETELALSPMTEVLLFAAERAQHVSELVAPSLEKGRMVISDRSLFSSIAFQGHGRGVPITTVTDINLTAVGNHLPDLVVLLDLEPALALERSKLRNQQASQTQHDRFEEEALKFHQKVRNGFLSLAAAEPERWLVLDAKLPPSSLADLTLERILVNMEL